MKAQQVEAHSNAHLCGVMCNGLSTMLAPPRHSILQTKTGGGGGQPAQG